MAVLVCVQEFSAYPGPQPAVDADGGGEHVFPGEYSSHRSNYRSGRWAVFSPDVGRMSLLVVCLLPGRCGAGCGGALFEPLHWLGGVLPCSARRVLDL